MIFQISIAELTLGIDLGDSDAWMKPFQSGIKMEGQYGRFIASQSDATALFLKPAKSLPKRHYRHSFNSSALWMLHYNDRKDFRIEFKKGFSGPTLAFVDVDLISGRGGIFYTREGLEDPVADPLPFVHPVDGVIFINLLPSRGGILLHACGVDDHGRGFIFPGGSGEGKSTTARLWHEEPGVKVLSDERTIIRETGSKFFIYGTPWHGEFEECDPGRIELETVLFLRHAEKNYLKDISAADAAARMFVRCLPTFWDKEGMELSLSLIERIVKRVPCYEFGFLPDKSAIGFLRNLN